jgi:hypothetical protein
MEPMPRLLSCPRGHYWEVAGGADGTCPACGDAPQELPLPELADGAPPPPAPQPPPPGLPPLRDGRDFPVVAGYEVHEDLGRGPTGITSYRARQAAVGRTVVLKVVFAREDRGQLAWGGLRGEASALGRLDHPNVVALHDAGERDRQLFYNAVEHVEGPTLAEALGGKPLPGREAALLVETLARAVAAAHARGVVHRSLKPASVLLRPAGTAAAVPPACAGRGKAYVPKITDWGLARRPVEGDVTDAELQGEHPSYLSPEQAWGRAREIGPSTDVYALGAILYACLTGRPPVRGESPQQTLELVQGREPVPPSRVARVAADLDAVCRRCLARQPRQRYESALELADDLRRHLDGQPVRARQAGVVVRLARWARRRRVALALLVGFCLGVAVVSSQIERRKPGADAPPWVGVNLQRQVAESSQRVLQAERASQRADYFRHILLAGRALDAKDWMQAHALLQGCPEPLRGWEWHHLARRSRGQSDLVLREAAQWKSLSVWPGGWYIAACGEPGNGDRGGVAALWQARAATSVPLPQDGVTAVRAVTFSPDGTRLALLVEGPVGRWQVDFVDPATGRRVFRGPTLPLGGRPTDLCYTPDGRRLLLADESGSVRLLLAQSGGELAACTPQLPDGLGQQMRPGPHARVVALRGDGERVAMITPDGKWVIVNVRSPGEPWDWLAGLPPPVRALAAHAGTVRLAAAGSDGSIQLRDFGALTTKVLRRHGVAVTGLAFSADGSRLASCCADGTVTLWDAAEGLEILSDKVAPGEPSAIAFSDGDELLAIAHGDRVTVWRGRDPAVPEGPR